MSLKEEYQAFLTQGCFREKVDENKHRAALGSFFDIVKVPPP